MKHPHALLLAALLPLSAFASTTVLFDETMPTWGTSGIAPTTATATAGVTVVSDPNLGTGNALRYLDKDTVASVRGFVDLAAPLLVPFQVNVQYRNLNYVEAGSNGARMRFGNSGGALQTESNAAFTVTFRIDSRVGAKHGADLTATSSPFDEVARLEVHSVSIIVNPTADPFSFLGPDNQGYTIPGLSYSVFLDGSVLGDGSGYTFPVVGANYNAALGIGRMGWTSSTADTNTEILFDNWTVTTDIAPIPEPATVAAVLGVLALALALGRRRA